MITRRTPRRPGRRAGTGLMAVLVAAAGVVALPATASAASAISVQDLNNSSYSTMLNDDGTFRLSNDASPDQCLDVDSGGNLTDSPCDTVGSTWNWQLMSDGSQDDLLRKVGTDTCVNGTSLIDCDSSEADFWKDLGDGLTRLSRQAAINLGSNRISICNQGGYVARAVIDYQVRSDPDSDNWTSDRRVIESFPAGQCRTETLPAGKVYGTVELRRYTGWYMGNYAFWDGDTGAYAGSSNDQLTANWAFAGDHIDASYNMNGTTCFSDSGFDPSPANQAVSTKKDGQTGCNGVNPNALTASIVGSLLGEVLPSVIPLVFA
ncbi:hypothetical protein [Streptomyces sp. NPDC058773]|uniref:hypothetical protein n=1 Tax=Streptomyces sp. NPDC058773 TaxID=3346632 RepID=UPI0036CE6035